MIVAKNLSRCWTFSREPARAEAAEELAEIAEQEEKSTPASLGGLLSWKNSSPLEAFHHRRPKRTDSTTLLLPIPSLREELNTPSEHSSTSQDKETAATRQTHKYTKTDSRTKANLSTLLEGSMNAENMIELQEENKMLKAELEALRINYAENIVPLQDLMDEKDNLDNQNTILKRDNEELCLVIERLEQEKTEVNGWFSDLESQMVRNFHSVFVEATKETTQKNLELRERITILEIELEKATGGHSRQEAEPVMEKTTRPSQKNQFQLPPLQDNRDSRSSTRVKDTETEKDGEDLIGPECATFSPSGQSEKELCWRDDDVEDFALTGSRRRRRSSFLGCRPTKEKENEVASDSERLTPKSTDDAQDFPSWDDDDKSPPVCTRRKRTDSGTLLLPIPSLREEQTSPTEMVPPLEDEVLCNTTPLEYAPPVKMSEKTILHTLKEDSPDNGNELAELRERVESLLLENKKLSDQLVCFRSGYEDRVTPFRDLFEEKRELLKKIGILGKETRTLRLQNARLSQENEGFNTSITELQSQMTMAVQKLVEKVKTLTAENANLKQQIAGLESEFSDNR